MAHVWSFCRYTRSYILCAKLDKHSSAALVQHVRKSEAASPSLKSLCSSREKSVGEECVLPTNTGSGVTTMTSATSQLLSLASGHPAFRNDGNPLLARGPGTFSGKLLLCFGRLFRTTFRSTVLADHFFPNVQTFKKCKTSNEPKNVGKMSAWRVQRHCC